MAGESVNDLVRRRKSNGRMALSIALVLVSIFFAVIVGPHEVSAAKTVTWERYDATLDLRQDGTYHITEEQQILFEGGTFSGGFASIPLDRVDDIGNIELSEIDGQGVAAYEFVPWNDFEEAPRTYSYRETGSEIEIGWGFPVTEDAARTFVLEYDVAGSLRVYGTEPDIRQQIWWTAVSKDVTDIALVEEASVTINLPRAIDTSTALLGVDAEENAADHTSDGQTWVWSESNLRAGDELIIRLEFPKLVDAPVPSWQAPDDTSRLEEEKADDRQSLYDLTFLGIGLLFTALGGIGLFGLWYGRGRDPHVGAVAEFLPTPPDDLPPGAAGALLDEVAHERDIVATVVDLGRRGVLKIDEQVKDESSILAGSRDFSLTLVDAEAEITPFEQTLVKSLFSTSGKDGEAVKLSTARSGFSRSAESIKEQMYAELVGRGYFVSSPEATRKKWRRGAIAALIVIVVLAIVAIGAISDVSGVIFFPVVVLCLVALGLIWLSDALPQKTLKGAEASAKWNAFRRYLGDIERYDKLAESQQIFDKYIPYAVAFGLEESWVRKFSAAGAAPPAWYGPVIISGPRDWSERPYRGGHSYGGGTTIFPSSGGQPRSSGGGGDFDMPSLQEMSDSAGKSLQGSSNSFFDMLGSAAKAFSDMSSSGGGNRRHWGGGGGGFRGGGSRGGSSGGGKRGFH